MYCVVEEHRCRAGFVKCPNSYCISTTLVCDGEMDCLNGEDETQCGKNYELLINVYTYAHFVCLCVMCI